MNQTTPLESLIITLRAKNVLVDADLARIYGVTTKRLNEQVKRNADRFPEDFVFRLTLKEKDEVVANCDPPFETEIREISSVGIYRARSDYGGHGVEQSGSRDDECLCRASFSADTGADRGKCNDSEALGGNR